MTEKMPIEMPKAPPPKPRTEEARRDLLGKKYPPALAEIVPAVPGQKERIPTLKARGIYGVYDGAAMEFRTGIEFLKLAPGKDQTFWATYLNKNCHSLSP